MQALKKTHSKIVVAITELEFFLLFQKFGMTQSNFCIQDFFTLFDSIQIFQKELQTPTAYNLQYIDFIDKKSLTLFFFWQYYGEIFFLRTRGITC